MCAHKWVQGVGGEGRQPLLNHEPQRFRGKQFNLDIGTGEGIAIVLYYLSSGDENKMFAT